MACHFLEEVEDAASGNLKPEGELSFCFVYYLFAVGRTVCWLGAHFIKRTLLSWLIAKTWIINQTGKDCEVNTYPKNGNNRYFCEGCWVLIFWWNYNSGRKYVREHKASSEIGHLSS